MSQRHTETLEWLYRNAGPIVRWRTIRDLGFEVPETEARATERAILETPEVRRWLGNLGGRAVHGSKDKDAENALAKLVEYGLHTGIPEFDAAARPYADAIAPDRQAVNTPSFVGLMGGPLLIAAGYTTHPSVRAYFRNRLNLLHQTALAGNYDLLVPDADKSLVPAAWRGKHVIRSEFYEGQAIRLPMCYDLYALAHWPAAFPGERRKIDDIVRYLSDPRFQETPGGYLWDTSRKTCYAFGREVLACITEKRTVLFLTLMARFAPCRKQQWFRDGIATLENCRTPRGTYRFPPHYLPEKRNCYYFYSGGHMGLGEKRSNPQWCEIESTFRMLHIQRLMQDNPPSCAKRVPND